MIYITYSSSDSSSYEFSNLDDLKRSIDNIDGCVELVDEMYSIVVMIDFKNHLMKNINKQTENTLPPKIRTECFAFKV